MKKFTEWLDNKIINEMERQASPQQANNNFQLDTSFDNLVKMAEDLYRKTQNPVHKNLYEKLTRIQEYVKNVASGFNMYRSFDKSVLARLRGEMDIAFQLASKFAPTLVNELKTTMSKYFNFIKMNEKI